MPVSEATLVSLPHRLIVAEGDGRNRLVVVKDSQQVEVEPWRPISSSAS